jgi:hypothetical protein
MALSLVEPIARNMTIKPAFGAASVNKALYS